MSDLINAPIFRLVSLFDARLPRRKEMTKDRITHLRTLCSAATPGRWQHAVYKENGWEYDVIETDDDCVLECNSPERQAYTGGQDLAFIAEARTALPEALGYIEELEARVRELEAEDENARYWRKERE